MKIKICGLTSVEEAGYLNEVHADYAGFILYFPKSKRNIDLETAKHIMAALDDTIKKTAVVVSPDRKQAEAICDAGFDYIQIHGTLSDEVFEHIKIPIVRAFNVSNMDEVEKLSNDEKVAGFLFDAAEPGSGSVFDWNRIPKAMCGNKMIFLAGGLTPENVARAVETVMPDCVDVSSGVENDSGFGKDPDKIRAFAASVRKASDIRNR